MVQMVNENITVELLRHNTWANLGVLDACAPLNDAQLDITVPATYGSIRDTLLHLVRSEQIYLSTLTGHAPDEPLQRDQFPGFAVLREQIPRIGAGLAQEAAQRRATDTCRRVTADGVEIVPVGILFIQTLQHSTEHRTELNMILTHLGITPPDLGGWCYAEAAETAL